MVRVSAQLLCSMVLLSLVSCTGTGGTIGGLFPVPKLLKGKVEGAIYYAPENAFSVRLPHPPTQSKEDDYEWTYTKIHELHDGPLIGVVFGPAAFDLNMYHAVLVRGQMKDDKDTYVKDLFTKKVKSRLGTYTQKTMTTFMINGRKCYYAVYEGERSFLVLSLTDSTSSFFAVEADIAKQSAIGRATLDDLVNRKWNIFNDMLSSFSISSAQP